MSIFDKIYAESLEKANPTSGLGPLENMKQQVEQRAEMAKANMNNMSDDALYDNFTFNAGNLDESENAINRMGSYERSQNYGHELEDSAITQQAIRVANQHERDQQVANNRNVGEMLTDGVTDVATGAAQGLLGLGAMASLPIDGALGTNVGKGFSYASDKIEEANDFLSSEGRRRNNKLFDSELRGKGKVSEDLYQDDILSGMGSTEASIRKIARDAGDTLGSVLTNPGQLSKVTMEGVGSMMVPMGVLGLGGKVTKSSAEMLSEGLKKGSVLKTGQAVGVADNLAVGKAVPNAKEAVDAASKTIDKSNKLIDDAAKALNPANAATHGEITFARQAAVTSLIAGMEGGGAAIQTMQSIYAMTHEQLMNGSQDYVDYINEGYSPEQAQEAVAKSAAAFAGYTTAVAAVGPGYAVSKIASNPMKQIHKSVVGSAIKETLEEGYQEGSSQLLSNTAIKKYADKDHRIDEGVGQGIALGAVGGLGSTAVIGSPAIAIKGTANTIKGAGTVLGLAGKGIAKTFKSSDKTKASKEDKIIAKEGTNLTGIREQLSLNSNVEDVSKLVEEATSNIKEITDEGIEVEVPSKLTDEEKTQLTNFTTQLVEFVNQDLELGDAYDSALGSEYAEKAKNTTNLADKMEVYYDAVINKEMTPDERAHLMNAVTGILGLIDEHVVQQIDTSLFSKLDPNNQAVKEIEKYMKVVKSVSESPEMVQAYNRGKELMKVLPVEGMNASNTLNMLVNKAKFGFFDEESTDFVDSFTNEVNEGKVDITPQEQSNLDFLNAIYSSVEEINQDSTATDKTKQVAYQVLTEPMSKKDNTFKGSENKKSGLDYANEIRAASEKGNKKATKASLEELGLFVDHMQNKLKAVNENYNSGVNAKASSKPVPTVFVSLSLADRQFTPTGEVYISPFKTASVRTAQAIENEARVLANLFNNLNNVYGDGSLTSKEEISLPDSLQGNPDEVAKTHFKAKGKKVDGNDKVTKTKKKLVTPQKKKKTKKVEEAEETTSVVSEDSSTNKTIPKEQEVDISHWDSMPIEDSFMDSLDDSRIYSDKEFEDIYESLGIDTNDFDLYHKTKKNNSKGSSEEINIFKGNRYKESDIKDGVHYIYDPKDTSYKTGEIVDGNIVINVGSLLESNGLETYANEYLTPGLRNIGLYPREFIRIFTDKHNKIRINDAINFIEQVQGNTELFREAKFFNNEGVYPTEGYNVMNARIILGSLDNRSKSLLKNMLSHPNVTRRLNPNLVDAKSGALKDRNGFFLAFQPSVHNKSILGNVLSPVEFTKDYLSSSMDYAMRRYKGTKLNYRTDANRFKQAIEIVEQVVNTAMDKALNSKTKGDNINHLFTTNVAPYRFAGRHSLNLVENTSGTFEYNQKFKDYATLALTQILMNPENYINQRKQDDLAEEHSINARGLDTDTITELNNGLTTADLIRSLAQNIKSYMGMDVDNSQGIGLTEGIFNAFATDILAATKSSFFNENVIDVPYFDNKSGEFINQTAKVYVPKEGMFDKIKPTKVKDLLDRALTFKQTREKLVAPVKASNMYLRTNTPLSNEQIKTITKLNNIQYKRDKGMMNLYNLMDVEDVIKFALPDYGRDKDTYNKNHLAKLEGQAMALRNAYNYMNEYSDFMDENNSDVAYFDHNVSNEGRFHQVGSYPPQTSKLVREVLLPTHVVTNISNQDSKEYKNWMLAVAQGIGVSVNNMTLENSIKDAKDKLSTIPETLTLLEGIASGLHPENAINLVETFQREVAEARDMDMSTVDNTFVSLHALHDYARYMGSNSKQRSKFDTSLYVEIDGINKGPTDAIALLMARLNDSRIEAMNATGIYFEAGENINTNQMKNGAKKDLYTMLVDTLRENNVLNTNKRDESLRELMINKVANVLSTLYDEATITSDGNVTLTRNGTKNPLTITMYGSGSKGIAENITKAIVEQLYASISEVLNTDKVLGNVVVDPNKLIDGRSQLQVFNDAIEDLKYLSDNKYYFDENSGTEKIIPRKLNTKTDFNNISDKDFTLDSREISSIAEAINEMFTKDLALAVSSVVTPEVSSTSKAVGSLVNIVSGIAKMQLEIKIKEYLKEQESINKEEFSKGDYISNDKLNEFIKDIEETMPGFKLGFYKMNYVTRGKSDALSTTNYGKGYLADSGIFPEVMSVSLAGVKGQPFFAIGNGDASMMVRMNESLDNVLAVHDGINTGLDNLDNISVESNKAIYEAWKHNPLKYLAKATANRTKQFEGILKDALSLGYEKEFRSLTEAFMIKQNLTLNEQLDSVLNAWTENFAEVYSVAREREVFSRMMDKTEMTVHNMGAVESPYNQEGLRLGTEEYKAEYAKAHRHVNKYFKDFINKPDYVEVKDEKVLMPKPIPKNYLEGTGSAPLGLLKSAGVKYASNSPNIEMIKRLSKLGLVKNMNIVIGEMYSMDAHLDSGLQMDDSLVYGKYDADKNTIFISDKAPNITETLVHEMIHAATAKYIFSVYDPNGWKYSDDKSSPAKRKAIELAVKDIESAAEAFYKSNAGKSNLSTGVNDFLNVYSTLRNTNKAHAVAEFVAWGLANRDMEAALTNSVLTDTEFNEFTESASSIKKAISAIKGFMDKVFKFLGITNIDKVGNQLDRLKFNTEILNTSNVDINAVNAQNITNFHSIPYNDTNPNLDTIMSTFSSGMKKYTEDRSKNSNPVENTYGTALEYKRFKDQLSLLEATGYTFTDQQKDAFLMIATAVNTNMVINPQSVQNAQTLFETAVKELSPDILMDDRFANDPNDYLNGLDRFNIITGNSEVKMDGRLSTTLSTFIALSQVSPQFRKELSDIKIPKTKLKYGSTDEILNSLGSEAMDSLNEFYAGRHRDNVNVTRAMDSLVNKMSDIVSERKNAIDTVSEFGATVSSNVNGYVVGKLRYLGNSMQQANVNKAVNRVLKIMSVPFVDDYQAAIIADDALRIGSTKVMPDFIMKLFSDLAGRTEFNGDVYDMIKVVKSTVQAMRQRYREKLPVYLANKFNNPVTKENWKTMFDSLGSIDMASLLVNDNFANMQNIINNDSVLNTEISNLESSLQSVEPRIWDRRKAKAEQLANYMRTGIAGSNLLRNATQVARLQGERASPTSMLNENQIAELDKLISLYAYRSLDSKTKQDMRDILTKDSEAVEFMMQYMKAQVATEAAKDSNSVGYTNRQKGYLPQLNNNQSSLVVVKDSDAKGYTDRSFVRIGDYKGSKNQTSNESYGYYYLPLPSNPMFHQGIAQNVKDSVQGLDALNGAMLSSNAGLITDKNEVNLIHTRMQTNPQDTSLEGLVPIYNTPGDTAPSAYQRLMSKDMLAKLDRNTNVAELIGAWRGRQEEEAMSMGINRELVDKLDAQRLKDTAKNVRKQYVDILDPQVLRGNPVLRDAVNLLTPAMKNYMKSKNDGKFLVRRDMIDDAFGYRMPMVTDFWTGNSKWSPEVQKAVRDIAYMFLGKDAYRKLLKAQLFTQGLVQDARTIIVVKSMVVPAVNAISNALQLMARGIPPYRIVKETGKKLNEINAYVRSKNKLIELDAEIRATNQSGPDYTRLMSEYASIEDSMKRLSIAPLIEAGEFTSVSDAAIDRNDNNLSLGKVDTYFENLVDQLPESVKTMGRYAIISKDTALFKGLQKSVDYADFIAKAMLYDHWIKQGKSSKEALNKITDEFVHYDKLPGRNRHALENLGLLWFWNWKIRSTKVAISIMRDNPVQALLASNMPMPNTFGSVGTPIDDSVLARILGNGSLTNSVGPGMGIRAPFLNPWYNMIVD